MASSPAPVGASAARGALWTILFSALSKAVALGSQVALAWLLFPEDFGLAAMTLSFTSVVGIVGGNYLRNVLIQRPDRFEQEAGQVFWLSLALNVLAAVTLWLLSPLAGFIFKEPRVVSLIGVVALTAPINALSVVHSAALNRKLCFRQLAAINFGAVLVQHGGAVLLASLGCGAYSLLVPAAAMSAWTAVASRLAAGRLPLGWPEPRRWLLLRSSVGWLMFNSLFVAVQNYGVNFAIGVVHREPAVAGYYFWGFTMASQAVFLIATNLQGVLFPALSKLTAEPDRQFEAVRRTCQTLTVAVVPLCVLQILLAEPAIHLVFHERWLPSVPVVQWLSLGLLTQPVSIVASAVLLARGAYSRVTLTTALTALTLVGMGLIGAHVGRQSEIARCTGLGLLLTNLLTGWIACREMSRDWKELVALIAPPLALGILSGAIGGGVAHLLQGAPPLLVMASVVMAAAGSYLLLVRLFLGQVVVDFVSRLRTPANCHTN